MRRRKLSILAAVLFLLLGIFSAACDGSDHKNEELYEVWVDDGYGNVTCWGRYAAGTFVSYAVKLAPETGFVGWFYEGEACSSKLEYEFFMPAERVDLVLEWTNLRVSVYFNWTLDGVKMMGNSIFGYPNGDVNMTVRHLGGRFLGWYNQDGDRVSDQMVFKYRAPTRSSTVTAVFMTY